MTSSTQNSGFQNHSTHREVMSLELNIPQISARFFSVFCHKLFILMSDCCARRRQPVLRRENSFNIICDPKEFSIRIYYRCHWHFQRHECSFFDGFNVKWQIPKLVQISDVCRVYFFYKQRVLNVVDILSNNFLFCAAEKVSVKVFNQIFFCESLQSECDYSLSALHVGGAWCPVAIDELSSIGILHTVSNLIEVCNQASWIDSFCFHI
ncbi:hypothetical protein EDO6_06502 [Paenibacillus xylanexedens]|nr:hypothetical protein EDO6_06502 [Paenibacillus xylanexedens]